MCEIDYGYLQMMRSDVMIADKSKYNKLKACPFFCKCKCKCQKQLELNSKDQKMMEATTLEETKTTQMASSIPIIYEIDEQTNEKL